MCEWGWGWPWRRWHALLRRAWWWRTEPPSGGFGCSPSRPPSFVWQLLAQALSHAGLRTSRWPTWSATRSARCRSRTCCWGACAPRSCVAASCTPAQVSLIGEGGGGAGVVVVQAQQAGSSGCWGYSGAAAGVRRLVAAAGRACRPTPADGGSTLRCEPAQHAAAGAASLQIPPRLAHLLPPPPPPCRSCRHDPQPLLRALRQHQVLPVV